MKITVIADDLTGANDTGVQLAKRGISTSVLLELTEQVQVSADAVCFDADSRSLSSEEAYHKVKLVCEYIQHQQWNNLVYKKIDSTLRGNIGAEMDAIYDSLQPDFIVIAPSYPQMGRVTINGMMYVDGIPLQATNISSDPKHPVLESDLTVILKNQTNRGLMLVTLDQLRGNKNELDLQLRDAAKNNKPYLIFDAETIADLQLIKQLFSNAHYRIVWCGSAGLANALSADYEGLREQRVTTSITGPVLAVVGSANSVSRRQLDLLLGEPDVIGFELNTVRILDDKLREGEIEQIIEQAVEAIITSRSNIVLYSSHDVSIAHLHGASLGMHTKDVSNRICQVLGTVAQQIITKCEIRNLILTGGDTAKQVCTQLDKVEIELLDEIETGVPLGRISGNKGIHVVTKAGSFGTEEVLCKALHTLRGGVAI